MLCNVPDRHKRKGGGTVSEFDIFIACIVEELKKGPDKPVEIERMGTYDKESANYPNE